MRQTLQTLGFAVLFGLTTLARADELVSPGVSTTIEFLNTADDAEAFNFLPKIDAKDRPAVVINSLKKTESLLIENGWTKCAGPLVRSESTPFGFQFFVKVQKCFYSASENVGLWISTFTNSSLKDQSLFFAAIERLRRTIDREFPSRDPVRTRQRGGR